MGKLVLILTDRPAEPWRNHLLHYDPDLDIGIWPVIDDFENYDTAVVWKHPQGLLKQFSNLKLVCSMGAGVDHILSDPDLPEGIAITRIVDEQLTHSMSSYIATAILNHQRRMYEYFGQRKQKSWHKLTPNERQLKIGILGLGVLGQDAAAKLIGLGLEVHGFAQSTKDLGGIKTYAGEAGLNDMLKVVNVLVNLLPLTSKTQDFLNLPFFEKCQAGTYLINVARGQHLVETDLLRALDRRLLSGAMLDVFREEPLPDDHPFWKDDRIMITPHIASVTDPASASAQIAENHRRLQQGKPLLHTVDRAKEY